MRKKRRWADLDQGQQIAIVAGAAAELVLTAAAVLDLTRRPASALRGGSKILWLLAFVVQPFGPLAYFSLGRRQS